MVTIPLEPWQQEFAADVSTFELGMLGGLGSGKTFVFCVKAIILASLNAEPLALDETGQVVTRGGLFEPTNNLVTTHLLPYMMAICKNMRVPYDYLASKQIMVLKFKNGVFPILLQSAENHERIVGYNWAFAGFEELDTSKFEIAKAAYSKGKERIRWGKVRQIFTTSTIEGNKFLQYNFVEKANSNKRTIHANTEDSILHEPGYVEGLRETMSPAEYAVRVQGNWGSILSDRVYPDYDGGENSTNKTLKDFLPAKPPLHLGMDFNSGKCFTIVHVIANDIAYAIDEHSSPKNLDTIDWIKRNYPEHTIICYPDTSGKNENYIGYDTAIQQLRDAGFIIKMNSRKQSTGSDDLIKGSNPFVGDRIHAFNARILNMNGARRYLVNKQTCPKLHNGLQNQQWLEDKDGTRKPDKTRDIDHPLDGAGYFVFYNWPIRNGRPTARILSHG